MNPHFRLHLRGFESAWLYEGRRRSTEWFFASRLQLLVSKVVDPQSGFSLRGYNSKFQWSSLHRVYFAFRFEATTCFNGRRSTEWIYCFEATTPFQSSSLHWVEFAFYYEFEATTSRFKCCHSTKWNLLFALRLQLLVSMVVAPPSGFLLWGYNS